MLEESPEVIIEQQRQAMHAETRMKLERQRAEEERLMKMERERAGELAKAARARMLQEQEQEKLEALKVCGSVYRLVVRPYACICVFERLSVSFFAIVCDLLCWFVC
jgi:hypothetical protein